MESGKPLFSFDEIAGACGGEWLQRPSGRGVGSVNTDSRKEAPGSLFIALSGESFDAHDFLQDALAKGAALLCVEKAKAAKVPSGAPAIAVGSCVEAYQRLANFHRRRMKGLKVVALTGSSGKTSTKEMLRAIFVRAFGEEHVLATEGNLNNQVGVPLTLLKLESRHKVCVVEMGTNHFGEIEPLSKAAEPDVALIVSIGRCHLEHFGSTEGVAREKGTIFRHLAKDGTAVIPAVSDGLAILEAEASGLKSMRFGDGPGSDLKSNYLGGLISGSSFELQDLRGGAKEKVSWSLSGRHQAGNAAGAACAAMALGVELPVIAEGLAACSLPGMRMRLAEHGGATWINDAYNANPDSMKASLEWLADFADQAKLVIALGDMRELGDIALKAHVETLEFATSRLPGARIAAVGPFMSQAAAMLAKPSIRAFQDSAGAAPEVAAMARPGDTVFLKASRGTRLELLEPKTP